MIRLNVRSRLLRTALLFGVPCVALGQDPISGEVDGRFSPYRLAPVYLSVRIPTADRPSVWGQGLRRAAVVTRDGDETSERYVVNSIAAGFSAPLRIGGRCAAFRAQGTESWLDGRASEGDVPARFVTGEIALEGVFSPWLSYGVSGRARSAGADYAGPLLGSGLTGIGEDPDLDVRLRERALGASLRGTSGKDGLGLGVGRASIRGTLAAVGSLDRLALPLDADGTDLSIAYDRRLAPGRRLELSVATRSFSGEGDVTRDTRGAVGRGRSGLRTVALSLARTDDYANGGSLTYGIETARSRFEAEGSVASAADAGVEAPAGSSVRYTAGARSRRTEAAVQWRIPQRRGRLTLGYRHAIVEAELSASYELRLFLVGAGGEVRERLDRTAAGIFDVGYERRVGEYDLGLSLQQIVPYRFGSSGGGGGGGIGGSGGGGSSRTEGGWTLGFRLGRRF